MTDKERIDTFLSLFKKLEKELVAQSKIRDSEFISFSRALNKIHYDRLNPVIASQDNYDFLKTASDVRNLLSHEENTVIPTEDFILRFKKITMSVLHPLKCIDIATRDVFTCSRGTSLYKVMQVMDEKNLSHVPILDNRGMVTGVFSRETFFDKIISQKECTISDELLISDFEEEYSLSGHRNESYFFVSRTLSIEKAYDYLIKKNAREKKVALLLVTEHGKPEEKLLGVITALDLAKTNSEI